MRVFVGVELPEAVRSDVAQWLASRPELLPDGRRARAGGLHVTLAFLGERDAGAVAGIAASLRRALRRLPSFETALGGGGVFPRRGRGRVAWIGFAAEGDWPRLHERVAGALRGLASEVVDDRPYHAHVTVARARWGWPVAVGRAWSAAVPRRLAAPFRVDGATLFESLPEPGGSRYEAVERFPLAAAA